MEMRREERINRLRQALKRTDKLHLKDAAALLGVSEMTVRRDLSAESTSVVLLGGYVVTAPHNNPVTRYFVSDQQARHVDEKAQAGWRRRWSSRTKHCFSIAAPPRRLSLMPLMTISRLPPFAIR